MLTKNKNPQEKAQWRKRSAEALAAETEPGLPPEVVQDIADAPPDMKKAKITGNSKSAKRKRLHGKLPQGSLDNVWAIYEAIHKATPPPVTITDTALPSTLRNKRWRTIEASPAPPPMGPPP